MAENILDVTILHRYDTEANWIKYDPILQPGEMAISSDKHGQFKTGVGTLKWSQLSYNQVPWTSVVGRPSTMNPTTTTLTTQDLDTIKTAGFYNSAAGNSVLHKPSDVNTFGLLVYKSADGFIIQELTEGNAHPGKKWIRQYNSSSWSSWAYFYSTLHPQLNISGNAATASIATKLGTTTIGSTAKPIYLNAGVPTAFTSTVGAANKPIYMNAGTLTASNATIGSATVPTYLNNGTMTACTSLSLNTTGSAARWTTARAFRIGNTAKSVNGSENYTWTLAEIGAAPAIGSVSLSKLARIITLGDGNSATILQNGGAYHQKIEFFDNATAGDGVFSFSQSSNSGSSFTTLLEIRDDGNIVANKFTGTLVGRADTASKWATARSLKIGNTAKNLDGSANLAWTHTELGVLPLTGGTLTGLLTANKGISISTAGGSWISGMTQTQLITFTGNSTANYHPMIKYVTNSGNVINIGALGNYMGFFGFKNGRTDNGIDSKAVLDTSDGKFYASGGFVGPLTGNAATASKWVTPRILSLTGSVTGSGSIDGSGNVSITTTTNHTHSYLPLTGGTITGNVSYNMHGTTRIPLKVYGGDANAQAISVGAGGSTIVGSGESAKSCENLLSATAEQLWLTSDNDIFFYTKCQVIGEKVGVVLNGARSFYPNVNNTGTLGTSSYKWNNVYATTFTGNLTGTATKATQDGSGNTITSKYVTVDTTQNISGIKTFTNSSASTSKSTGALKVSGGVGVAGQMSANKVMIGDHCTLEYSSDGSLDFVFS